MQLQYEYEEKEFQELTLNKFIYWKYEGKEFQELRLKKFIYWKLANFLSCIYWNFMQPNVVDDLKNMHAMNLAWAFANAKSIMNTCSRQSTISNNWDDNIFQRNFLFSVKSVELYKENIMDSSLLSIF